MIFHVTAGTSNENGNKKDIVGHKLYSSTNQDRHIKQLVWCDMLTQLQLNGLVNTISH